MQPMKDMNRANVDRERERERERERDGVHGAYAMRGVVCFY